MPELHVIVNIGSDGDIKCFCPYDEYLQGKCACREKYNCPEAILEVKVISGTKPSDQIIQPAVKATRDMDKVTRKIKGHARKIKEATARFEKSVKGSRFRI